MKSLTINQEKNEISRFKKKIENRNIRISEHTFNEVKKCKYLLVMLANNGEREMKMKEKISTTNKVCNVSKKMLKTKLLSTKLKI